MKHAHFIQQIDDEKIAAAIASAHANTTSAVRLLISKRDCADPVASAERHFRAMQLDKRLGRDAILIFVAPLSHTFAIYGDAAVHEKFGDALWATLRDETAAHLKESRFTDGLVHAIGRIGELLATHFPRREREPGKSAR
jgi:uncharacterized membrane protein